MWYCLSMMTEFKKRKLGLVYDAFDKDILKMQQYTRRLVDEYNSLSFDDEVNKLRVLKTLFPKDNSGDYRTIEKPMLTDNCFEVSIGKNFYANVDTKTTYFARTLEEHNKNIARANGEYVEEDEPEDGEESEDSGEDAE